MMIIAGPSLSGKSQIRKRIAENKFDEKYKQTIGFNNDYVIVEIDNEEEK